MPARKNILVQPIEEESPKSAGGILLVAQRDENLVRGIVVAIGPKAEDVAVGDRVVYTAIGASLSYYEDDVKYHILDDDDILGKLKD